MFGSIAGIAGSTSRRGNRCLQLCASLLDRRQLNPSRVVAESLQQQFKDLADTRGSAVGGDGWTPRSEMEEDVERLVTKGWRAGVVRVECLVPCHSLTPVPEEQQSSHEVENVHARDARVYNQGALDTGRLPGFRLRMLCVCFASRRAGWAALFCFTRTDVDRSGGHQPGGRRGGLSCSGRANRRIAADCAGNGQ